MRLSSRRADEADLIRARLRALLDDGRSRGGWLPAELPDDDDAPDVGANPEFDEAIDADDEDDDGAAVEHRGEGLPAGLGRHRAPGSAARIVPSTTGLRAMCVAALLGALLVVGWTWWDRPRGEAVESSTPVTSASPATPAVDPAADSAPTVTVSVVGQVVRPGLVVLPEGSRIADALAAAGGPLPGVDPASVNLAAVVTDGQQIVVAAVGLVGGGDDPSDAPAGKLSLNSATVADLDALPGIGPVLAGRILDYRERNGPFTSVEQLDDVPGIGPAIFDELAPLVTV